jgi:hypothetical protein
MKQTIRFSLLLGIFSLLTPLFAPLGVSAVETDPGSGGGGNPSTSTTCDDQAGVDLGEGEKEECAKKTAFTFGSCGNTNVTISCLAAEVMKFLSALVGIAVVAGITVGGIIYSTGSGNPAKTQKGVSIIINSVLGLMLFLLMFAIINFLIPGGVFK